MNFFKFYHFILIIQILFSKRSSLYYQLQQENNKFSQLNFEFLFTDFKHKHSSQIVSQAKLNDQLQNVSVLISLFRFYFCFALDQIFFHLIECQNIEEPS
jgi:hypothetical protein